MDLYLGFSLLHIGGEGEGVEGGGRFAADVKTASEEATFRECGEYTRTLLPWASRAAPAACGMAASHLCVLNNGFSGDGQAQRRVAAIIMIFTCYLWAIVHGRR